MSDTLKETIRRQLINSRQNLVSFLQGLDEAQWDTAVYSEDSNWTVADLLRHVADSERGMTGLMMQIRDGGEGVPPDFDLARWNARVVSKAKDKTPAELLANMEKSQARLFQFIDSLATEDWSKKGRHASLRILSIEEICRLIADHEQLHTDDMRRAVA